MYGYTYKGNVDNVGTSDGLKHNSVVWVESANASGTQPMGSTQHFYQLHIYFDGYNLVQLAFVYLSDNIAPDLYTRQYVNGTWSAWACFRELL